jgi:hypothetical protein
MNQNDQVFDTLAKAPSLLASLDALGIPGWALALAIVVATIGLLFAGRELAAWFLKTNSIADEVIRLETMIKDLQGDIHALEQAVLKTKAAIEPMTESAVSGPTSIQFSQKENESNGQPHFPLNH